MSENVKKFLEAISSKKEMAEKLNEASKEEIIAIAAKLGIALTDADFAQNNEISDDELDAVAGGVDNCYCIAGGGGSKTDRGKTCACILGGGGEYISGGARCVCVAMGIGENGYGQ